MSPTAEVPSVSSSTWLFSLTVIVHHCSYLQYSYLRLLRFTGTNRLLVPSVKRSTIGSRAFPVAGPKTWNAVPEDVTSFQSEYTFRHQLKSAFQ